MGSLAQAPLPTKTGAGIVAGTKAGTTAGVGIGIVGDAATWLLTAAGAEYVTGTAVGTGTLWILGATISILANLQRIPDFQTHFSLYL